METLISSFSLLTFHVVIDMMIVMDNMSLHFKVEVLTETDEYFTIVSEEETGSSTSFKTSTIAASIKEGFAWAGLVGLDYISDETPLPIVRTLISEYADAIKHEHGAILVAKIFTDLA